MDNKRGCVLRLLSIAAFFLRINRFLYNRMYLIIFNKLQLGVWCLRLQHGTRPGSGRKSQHHCDPLRVANRLATTLAPISTATMSSEAATGT